MVFLYAFSKSEHSLGFGLFSLPIFIGLKRPHSLLNKRTIPVTSYIQNTFHHKTISKQKDINYENFWGEILKIHIDLFD